MFFVEESDHGERRGNRAAYDISHYRPRRTTSGSDKLLPEEVETPVKREEIGRQEAKPNSVREHKDTD